MDLPFGFLLTIVILLIIYLILGLALAMWKIYELIKSRRIKKITPESKKDVGIDDKTSNQADVKNEDDIKLEDIKLTQIVDPVEFVKDHEMNNTDVGNSIHDPAEKDNRIKNLDATENVREIIIYFYLRYNIVSSTLGITIINIKNFPGPADGGFDEIQLKVTDLPKRSKKFRSSWKMYNRARFDAYVSFDKTSVEDLKIMNLRFRVYAKNQFKLPSLIVEGLLPLSTYKYDSSLCDTLMYVKIPLKSPFSDKKQFIPPETTPIKKEPENNIDIN